LVVQISGSKRDLQFQRNEAETWSMVILAVAMGMALSIIGNPRSIGQEASKDDDDQTNGRFEL